nr:vegetative cell wall protein gp1-like [Lolium perenne]
MVSNRRSAKKCWSGKTFADWTYNDQQCWSAKLIPAQLSVGFSFFPCLLLLLLPPAAGLQAPHRLAPPSPTPTRLRPGLPRPAPPCSAPTKPFPAPTLPCPAPRRPCPALPHLGELDPACPCPALPRLGELDPAPSRTPPGPPRPLPANSWMAGCPLSLPRACNVV